MREVYGRPVILIPLGVVLLLVGIVIVLNGIGSYRTGTAVAEARTCATADSDGCLLPVEVRVRGPVVTRRAAGVDYSVRATSGERLGRVTVDDGDDSVRLADLGGNTVTAWVKRDDPADRGDVVAFALPDGAVVPVLWIGLRGLSAYLTFGLLVWGFGVALLAPGLRFRRAGTPWLSADASTPFGAAAAALLILPAGVVVVLVRLGMPSAVVLGALGVATLGFVGGLVLAARGRGGR